MSKIHPAVQLTLNNLQVLWDAGLLPSAMTVVKVLSSVNRTTYIPVITFHDNNGMIVELPWALVQTTIEKARL